MKLISIYLLVFYYRLFFMMFVGGKDIMDNVCNLGFINVRIYNI